MGIPSLQNCRTPRWFFAELQEIFGEFALDAFAEPHNALCDRFLTEREDGTKARWMHQTFGNPPFKIMGAAVAHALQQFERYGTGSILVGPVGASQLWYHQHAIKGTIYVPDRRICFDLPDGTPTGRGGGDNGADRDTIVIGFGGQHHNRRWRRGEFRVRRLQLKGPQS